MNASAMKTVYQELLETREAELNEARDHIADLYDLLDKISKFLSDQADYDLEHGDSGYKPCNEAARLLQEIEMVAP